jgi:hypothetical protein
MMSNQSAALSHLASSTSKFYLESAGIATQVKLPTSAIRPRLQTLRIITRRCVELVCIGSGARRKTLERIAANVTRTADDAVLVGCSCGVTLADRLWATGK